MASIKIIVMGVGGVGKSAITNRFVIGRWVEKVSLIKFICLNLSRNSHIAYVFSTIQLWKNLIKRRLILMEKLCKWKFWIPLAKMNIPL